MGEDIRWHAQTESSDLFHQWSSSRCSIIDYITDHLLRFAKDWMRFALVSPGYVCRHSPSSLFFIPFGTSCLWTRKMPAEITIKPAEITIFNKLNFFYDHVTRPDSGCWYLRICGYAHLGDSIYCNSSNKRERQSMPVTVISDSDNIIDCNQRSLH